MNEYNELLDKLQLLYEHKDAKRLYRILSTITGLMNELDSNLKGGKYRETFRHQQLSLTITFGDYYDR